MAVEVLTKIDGDGCVCGKGELWQLMVSAGGDFTTEFRGPGVCRGTPPEGSNMGAYEGNNVKPTVIEAPVRQLTPDPGDVSEALENQNVRIRSV